MNNKTVVIIGVSCVIFGIIMLPTTSYAADANTSISATVGKTIDCSSGGTVNVGTVQPGNSATKTYTIGATTNSVDGFSITSSGIQDLTYVGGTETIPYTASASAGTRGYKIKPATYSEWKNSGGTTFTSNSIVEVGSVWRHSATTGTETLTVTVGTDNVTVAGSYSGTVSWNCTAN